ncbi:GH13882 [Drosophila grimshawi]|uniref:GH13882 n=1 Tax=Drosophila grimshawi TaxID=7222 RepID=B4K3C4_DROGR|nr:GH13882 [Drosophila grimshawi]
MFIAAASWSFAASWRLLCIGLLALLMLLPLLQFAEVEAASGRGAGGLGNQAVFTSSFLVRFRRGVDNDFAHKVADKYGFDNLGPVSNLTEVTHTHTHAHTHAHTKRPKHKLVSQLFLLL